MACAICLSCFSQALSVSSCMASMACNAGRPKKLNVVKKLRFYIKYIYIHMKLSYNWRLTGVSR